MKPVPMIPIPILRMTVALHLSPRPRRAAGCLRKKSLPAARAGRDSLWEVRLSPGAAGPGSRGKNLANGRPALRIATASPLSLTLLERGVDVAGRLLRHARPWAWHDEGGCARRGWK